MNERIRELAKQAGWTEAYYESDHGPLIEPEFNKEKFAELIVQDCRDMFVVNSPSWNLLNEKLEHFGVE